MEEAPELRRLIERFYRACSHGDIAYIKKLVAKEDDVLVVGTDPDEWWAGYEEVVGDWATQFSEMKGIPLNAGEIEAYREGSVGWVLDQPSFGLPDTTQSPIRLTAVFHQEEGQWKLVQLHASVGVANEAVIGQELTAD